MLQKDKPYGEVIGMPGVSFEQNGQLFNKEGIGVDDKGNAIESTPKIELPPIDTKFPYGITVEQDDVAEPEPEMTPEDPSSTILDLIDRIKIEGPSVKGYMPKKEIKEWLDMYNVSYTNFQSRKILAGLLKKELGL